MKIQYFSLFFFIEIGFAISQSIEPFAIFENGGEQTNYVQMLGKSMQADVILFGELHNNLISHWIQYNMVQDIYKTRKQNLIIGAEMFEADDQIKIDEFFNDLYSEKIFENECKLWNNYQTDYKNILLFAKNNKLKFVATSPPRRYANMVARRDFDALKNLPKNIKDFFAPLPIFYDSTLICYKNIISSPPTMGHNADPRKIAKSQAFKDATMANFIFKNWSKGKIFFHLNGSYHSDNYCGIYTYLKRLKKDIRIVTITTVEQEDLSSPLPEFAQIADFIIVVNKNFPKSY